MALNKKNELSLSLPIQESEVHTILGAEASFEGKLFYRGNIRIDGHFRGEIDSEDTLILGEGAHVEGIIRVGTLIVRGVVRGHAHAKCKTELLKGGCFYGEITTKALVVEDGAAFDGSCKMTHEEPAIVITSPKIEDDVLSIAH